ncbi:hypothetical protein MT487_01300 [Lachnospiraceae bacterium NSJ-171]|nr:hypothetical protein [Lachnospiraceae bacterium NSJ-171]DAZ44345.1 MAG TPA: hypothetical protein [Caudoviricetes sp.]
MIIKENEIPKHKKKTKSNVSKSKFKSKHKHQYKECLLQYDYYFPYTNKVIKHTSLCSYCVICGKIGDRFPEDKSIVKDYVREIDSLIKNYRHYSHISDEELYEKYHDKMPVFFVEDIFKEKYITIDGNNRE